MPHSIQADSQPRRNQLAPQPADPKMQAVEPDSGMDVPLVPASLDPGRLSPADVLRLQRMVGNRAVSQMLTAGRQAIGPVQARLTVGPVADPYEQEADRVAEQVLAAPREGGARSDPPRAQRQEEEEEEVQAKPLAAPVTPLVQRRAGASFEASPGIEGRLAVRRGAGAPLPHDTRAFMEQRFGADFNKVRLHTDPEAGTISRKLSARAFTYGPDIYLGATAPGPASTDGQRLLAHELAHVVQQAGAPRVQRNGGGSPTTPTATTTTTTAGTGPAGPAATERPRDPEEDPGFGSLSPLRQAKARLAYQKALQTWEAAQQAAASPAEASKPAEEPAAPPLGASPAPAPAAAPPPPGLSVGIGPAAWPGDWVVHGEDALFQVWDRITTGRNSAFYGVESLDSGARGKSARHDDPAFRSVKPEQKTIIQDYYTKPKDKLYPSVGAAGTFEYVSESLYQSLPPEHHREFWQKIYRRIGKAPWIKPREYTDPEKKQILLDMLHKAYVPYDRTYTPEQLNAKADELGAAGKLKQVDELFKVLIVQTADEAELRGIQGLSIGFHGTNQPMEVVAGAAGAETGVTDSGGRPVKGWGGIRQPQQVEHFQNQWGLKQTSWNPMAAYLADPKTKANFRLGINKDNDLLSTVSVGTRINPCIEFPHGKGKDLLQPNYVYAVVYERAYPTFVKQAEYGTDLPSFPEIAVEGVEPKRIIGNVAFQRQYTPDGQGNVSHADFKYYPMGGFRPNSQCQAEYAGPKYDKLRQVAEDQFTKEKHLEITAADPKQWSLGVA